MKVMTIVGTRPEIIKLSRVIAEISKHTEHVLVHTGQNYDYELNQVFFEDLGVPQPDHFLEAAGENAAETIGQVIAKADKVLEAEQPDAVLLYGDTNSCLAVIPAKRRKIPVFHFEAGNRCFDQRVPEELNRKIVDHLSDINMPLTEHARRYLINEGLRPETVIKTGSPMKEILTYNMEAIEASDILPRLGVEPKKFFIVSAHREENVDSEQNFNDLLDSLNALATTFDMPVIVATHPRTMKRLEALGREANKEQNMDERVQFLKAMGFFDYNKMQKEAFCVISDSGTITEESSILNVPAITVRQAHERPEGMDEGVLIMSGLKPDAVVRAVNVVTGDHIEGERRFRLVGDYDVDNFSLKVVRIVLSYVDYINRTVWRKML
ncbi:MAG: UDP-N-acetylglucosamine 2-epimerase (non-hydrolyzing) [Pseudomonadota bacterium]